MKKKVNIKNEPGFSLIELLAVIVIATLVIGIIGYTVIHTISKSKEKANQIAYANIKTSARYYVEENPTSIFWKKDDSNSELVYTCVSIDTLVNNGYIEQNKIEDYDDSNYILITKGANQSIISEKIDNVGVCTGFSGGVAIPTKKYCNDLTYDGTEQSLTDTLDAESKFSFSNDKGTNAGRYEVEATLKDSNDVWEDGSTDSKTITCTIKKAWPIISIEPDGNPGTSLTPISATFESKIAGSISLRSSNEEHATATVDNPKMENPGTRTITITPLASRTTTTTITITFNPEDSNNYYSGMTSFTLGNVGITEVEKPTKEKYCNNLVYNGNEQHLVKSPEPGYRFENYIGKEVGEYKVTAKLRYGYIWEDETTEHVTINCSITPKTYTITYNSNGGTTCSPSSKTVYYGNTYGTLCTPTRSGYTFNGWWTSLSGGSQVTESNKAYRDATIYAHWTKNTPTIPTVKLKIYKRNSSGDKEGSSIATITANSSNRNPSINSSSFTNNKNGWLNNANYPYGIYFEFLVSDSGGLSIGVWQWNSANLDEISGRKSSYTEHNNDPFDGSTSSTEVHKLEKEGYRNLKYTVTNSSGESVSISIVAKLDRTPPYTPNPDTNSKPSCYTDWSCSSDSSDLKDVRKCAVVKKSDCDGQTILWSDKLSGHDHGVFKATVSNCPSTPSSLTTKTGDFKSLSAYQTAWKEMRNDCAVANAQAKGYDKAGNVSSIYYYSTLNNHVNPNNSTTNYKVSSDYKWVKK